MSQQYLFIQRTRHFAICHQERARTMRVLIALAFALSAVMALNQLPQDSPVMMVHDQIHVDNLVYDHRDLTDKGKKRGQQANGPSQGEVQPISQEESNAS